ncbi:hypothetical protein CTI12_AA610720 [Artemisia annua]|uniref:Uncharacterized protein n=1 Tax=Artemisia annua TaxID=35608 RepID=A0A2U1KDB4_ARTAN|nr:hypothetical protein CTI12_AA610720 [Artemisia annua]
MRSFTLSFALHNIAITKSYTKATRTHNGTAELFHYDKKLWVAPLAISTTIFLPPMFTQSLMVWLVVNPARVERLNRIQVYMAILFIFRFIDFIVVIYQRHL